MAEHTRRSVLPGAAGVAAGTGLAGRAGARAASGPAPGAGHRFPYLEGAFKPVAEELTAFGLPVTGHVPRELNGR
ncbi:hypothetical protein ACFCWT_32545 [Streptomyces olivaceus]|uniref:hypothetical protein n=1 Tax=Streptomyces olivaceus TaxID=47716 RepID=UPI0035E0B952